jgi:hypothetical protein
MTAHEEEQLVKAIEQAVKDGVTSTRSTKPCTGAVGGGGSGLCVFTEHTC